MYQPGAGAIAGGGGGGRRRSRRRRKRRRRRRRAQWPGADWMWEAVSGQPPTLYSYYTIYYTDTIQTAMGLCLNVLCLFHKQCACDVMYRRVFWYWESTTLYFPLLYSTLCNTVYNICWVFSVECTIYVECWERQSWTAERHLWHPTLWRDEPRLQKN